LWASLAKGVGFVKEIRLILKDELASQQIGKICAAKVSRGIVFLRGELGGCKTCFSQSFIRAAGFEGRVKSPTYTLVEPYELADRNIYHFDLYRLQDEEELLFLGCDEYFEAAISNSLDSGAPSLCLVEWPEKAEGILPLSDIELRIEHEESSTLGRQAYLSAKSHRGENILSAMQVELESI